MHKLDPSRFAVPGLALLSVALVLGLAFLYRQQTQVYPLTLAAGDAHGESYVLSQALKVVVERHSSRIKITVRETGGTTANLALLEKNEAQLVTAQADVAVKGAARMIAVLYDDVFQLVIPMGSQAKSLPELRGMRIALPQHGGQYASFLAIAEHFNLHPSDFTFVGASDQEADDLFLSGGADALFRVRALGNPSILRLVRNHQARFLPIDQAPAMRIQFPAFEPSVIPQGAYLGNPPIPATDLMSVAVHRTLLVHREVPNDIVRAITEVLIEHRQELADAINPAFSEVRPLLASVRAPDNQTGLGAAVHEGAKDFYDRDKPSFITEHADFFGLILTLLLLVGSWLWELKRYIERRQKNHADIYSNRVVVLMNEARATSDMTRLAAIDAELLDLLTEAVRDLDTDRISEDSFQAFRAILQIALDVARRPLGT